MLKAVVVYVPGSGGNLLARSLALDSTTVALLPQSLAAEQPTHVITAEQRLSIYNNWNSQNWQHSETDIMFWYHRGLVDFVEYEQSSLQLIDQFHPSDFELETQRKLLWDTYTKWAHIIFIRYKETSFDQIVKLARAKRKDLAHTTQIPREVESIQSLIKQVPNQLDIHWEDMLELDSYINAVQRLGSAMNLTIHTELVSELWHSWKYNTELFL